MAKKTSVAIYALHPITYQTPIFEDLHNKLVSEEPGIRFEVLFGDDLSLRNVYYEHLNSSIRFDQNLRLDRFPNKFLKNYARDSRRGFFSRINPQIFVDMIVNRRDILLVHGYETFTAWIAIFLYKVFQRKVIFRGEAVLEGTPYHGGLVRAIKRKVLPILFKCIDKFAYSCDGNRRYFEEYGVENEKFIFMPCAVNNEYYLELIKESVTQVHEIRDRYKVPEEHFTILFCARFTDRKRPIDLIKAVSAIDHAGITILFVGDGPKRDAMERAAKDSEVNAIFTGFLTTEELTKLGVISHLAVNLSEKDPSPKSLNESMLFGLPVIVTDVLGTAKDLVESGVNGYIIPVGDTGSLAKHILFLKYNPKKRAEMGRNSLDKIRQWNYSVGTCNLIKAIKSLTK